MKNVACLQEMPVTMRRLVDTADYLVHSTLPTEGECGAVRQRLTALMRRVEDFGKMFTARRKNVTQAAQFFSLAQVVSLIESGKQIQITYYFTSLNVLQRVSLHLATLIRRLPFRSTNHTFQQDSVMSFIDALHIFIQTHFD